MFRPADRKSWKAGRTSFGAGWLDFGDWLMLCSFGRTDRKSLRNGLLSSEERRFGGSVGCIRSNERECKISNRRNSASGKMTVIRLPPRKQCDDGSRT